MEIPSPHTGPRPPRLVLPGSAPPPTRREQLEAALQRFLSLLWPPRLRHGAVAFAAAVIGLGAYGLWFWSQLPIRLPSEMDWQAATAFLARSAKPGDAVALSPPWAERARLILPPSLPVMALPRYQGEDLVNVRRIWLLSLPNAPGFDRELDRQLAVRSSGGDRPLELGGLELTRFDLASPLVPRAFLPDQLAAARVTLGDRPCEADAAGVFRCPDAPAGLRIAREVRAVEFLPRPCLFVHLQPQARRPITLRFHDVPLGTKLHGHTAIVGEAMLRGSAPVRLSVKVGDEEIGVAEEPAATPGWHAFQFDTTSAAGQARDVTFTVTSDDPDERPLCFDAMTLP